MKTFSKIAFVYVIAMLMHGALHAQLAITKESNGVALVERLLGQGVTVSNITITGNPSMTGFFRNFGLTKIGLDSGIVLTNGRAKSEPGNWGLDGNGIALASSIEASEGYGLPGDADIANSISVPVAQTNDACVLEFDFVPLGDSIKFRYVFSSEEYIPAYVCDFNDAFAFFISGPGITGLKNIALVPGTSIPVSIFNVNDVPGGACPNNPIYYINNGPNKYFMHDGHTKIFTAAEQVQPCQTYHLKLVIVDVGDDIVDSGVFLEAKSLSSNAIEIENTTQIDPSNNSYLVEGCSAGSFKILRPKAEAAPLTVALSYGGTAINGVDMQMLPSTVTIPANQTEVTINVVPIIDNTPEGIELIKVYALAGCTSGLPTDSTFIQIRDYDTLGINPDTAYICRNAAVQLTASAGYTNYEWDPNPTLSSTIIKNPIALPTGSTTTYYCTGSEGTCHGRDSSLVVWKELDLVSKKEINCKNDATGEIVVNSGPEWLLPVQYSINNGPYQTNNIFSNLPVGNYKIKITDGICVDSLAVNITQLFPDLGIASVPITGASCTGGADGIATINVVGGKAPYLFSTDGINFLPGSTLHLAPGNYTVTVKDANNCTSTQNIFMPLDNILTLDAGFDATICQGKTAQLNAISNANSYTWTPAATLSSDIIPNPVATPAATTKYYITVTTGICTQKDSVTVFINPAPIADAGPDSTICYGQDIKLSGSGGFTYAWYPSSNLDDAKIATPTASKLPGTITYYLNVINALGCPSLKRDSVLITLTRPAIVRTGRDTVLAVGQPLPLFASDVNHIGFIEYTWSPGYGLDDAHIASPTAILDRDMYYTVTARNSIGCEATDDIRIKVYKGPDIYVPNAFTPNGDGLNDILRAIPVGIEFFHYFRVYNRWGGLIFFTTNPLVGWDGKIKGTLQPLGNFVWMAEGIDYRGNKVMRKGSVLIVK